jgi:3-hydroxyisobutyrate dehydrogenase-like beta-hydroxyacid dehydrogenase
MTIATVGLLHPGAMGAAVGMVLIKTGRAVLWASDGRSAQSAARAEQAGLHDAGTATALAQRSDVVLSIGPPHGALDTARAMGRFTGLYVDANAVSPATAAEIRSVVERPAPATSTAPSSGRRPPGQTTPRACTSPAPTPRRWPSCSPAAP